MIIAFLNTFGDAPTYYWTERVCFVLVGLVLVGVTSAALWHSQTLKKHHRIQLLYDHPTFGFCCLGCFNMRVWIVCFLQIPRLGRWDSTRAQVNFSSWADTHILLILHVLLCYFAILLRMKSKINIYKYIRIPWSRRSSSLEDADKTSRSVLQQSSVLCPTVLDFFLSYPSLLFSSITLFRAAKKDAKPSPSTSAQTSQRQQKTRRGTRSRSRSRSRSPSPRRHHGSDARREKRSSRSRSPPSSRYNRRSVRHQHSFWPLWICQSHLEKSRL